MRRLAGDYPRAVQALDEALSTARDLGDRFDQTNTQNEMANLGWRTGDFTSAAQTAEQTLSIAAEPCDEDLRANALKSLGITQRLTGD